MCFRCEVCKTVCPPRQQMLRHVVYRTTPATVQKVSFRYPDGGRGQREIHHPARKDVERELPTCPQCHALLKTMSVPQVMRVREEERQQRQEGRAFVEVPKTAEELVAEDISDIVLVEEPQTSTIQGGKRSRRPVKPFAIT